ncbi:uncharacterized protein LOC125424043 [Ziziphus jujuba]|uniref:Uncharacterized protein LOC125424043 n=1 Tax=Ziziphus jujuba TaxID=326968 RepID=A0ABM3IVI2_ZIZJJ|nr:uncharacterized protein LOC125424043 [Ziziphus jujuba]
MRCEARKWMGAVIFKELGSVRYMGRVADYDVETGWFKVMYDDYDYDYMEKNELIQLMASPEQLGPYFNNLPDSSKKKRKPRRKKAPNEKKPAARNTSSLGAKRKTRSQTKKKTSSYIPPCNKREKEGRVLLVLGLGSISRYHKVEDHLHLLYAVVDHPLT